MSWNRSHVDLALTLWNQGRTAQEISERVPHSRSAVLSKLSRMGISRQDLSQRHEPVRVEAPPPSLAAIRLAEFDPVIARALRWRAEGVSL